MKNEMEIGVWNCLSSVELSIILGETFDFVYVDLEHGLRSIENLTLTAKIYNLRKIKYSVRIRSFDDPIIQSLLDLGVRNFILPQLRSLSELEQFKKRIFFPPHGTRGLHPRTTLKSNIPAVDSISVTVIVETMETIELLEVLAGDEIVNGFYFGAFDLSMELQIVDGPFSPSMKPYINRVSNVCRSTGKTFQAMLPNVNDVAFAEHYNVDKVLVGIDSVLMEEYYIGLIRNLRGK